MFRATGTRRSIVSNAFARRCLALDRDPAARCEPLERRLLLYNTWPLGGWGDTSLGYSYANILGGKLNGGMSDTAIRDSITEALGVWSAVAPLRFTQVSDGGWFVEDVPYVTIGDLDIRFGQHGLDDETYAHGFYPSQPYVLDLEGDVHFNSNYTWAAAPNPPSLISAQSPSTNLDTRWASSMNSGPMRGDMIR